MLQWSSGERQDWQRSARWHADAGASTGFERRDQTYLHTVETSPRLSVLAARHLPFYDQLHAVRVSI